LLIGGSPFQGRYPASEVNDGDCPEKPDHLNDFRDFWYSAGENLPSYRVLLDF